MTPETPKEKLRCLCVHGTCREGEQECSGGCKEGYGGVYCDVPTSDDVLKHVNKNKKKDYTGDGLYRPQQISDQRMTDKHGKSTSSSDTHSDSSSGASSSLKAKKIGEGSSSYGESSYVPPSSSIPMSH